MCPEQDWDLRSEHQPDPDCLGFMTWSPAFPPGGSLPALRFGCWLALLPHRLTSRLLYRPTLPSAYGPDQGPQTRSAHPTSISAVALWQGCNGEGHSRFLVVLSVLRSLCLTFTDHPEGPRRKVSNFRAPPWIPQVGCFPFAEGLENMRSVWSGLLSCSQAWHLTSGVGGAHGKGVVEGCRPTEALLGPPSTLPDHCHCCSIFFYF